MLKVRLDFAVNVSQIITFDMRGISGHPNHIALPKGVADFAQRHPKYNVSGYSLITVPLLQKYSGALAPLFQQTWSRITGRATDPAIRFVSDYRGYAIAFRAMQQHWSQLVWFRWLYILTSRYMWINEWTAITA